MKNENREIADDDLAVVSGHLRRERTFAAAKQTVKWIEEELVGHPRPGHLQR